ncbi:MAG TPA: hypothetical protein VF353_06075 [Candidatus Binatia bacterium]
MRFATADFRHGGAGQSGGRVVIPPNGVDPGRADGYQKNLLIPMKRAAEARALGLDRLTFGI